LTKQVIFQITRCPACSNIAAQTNAMTPTTLLMRASPNTLRSLQTTAPTDIVYVNKLMTPQTTF